MDDEVPSLDFSHFEKIRNSGELLPVSLCDTFSEDFQEFHILFLIGDDDIFPSFVKKTLQNEESGSSTGGMGESC